MGLPKRPTTQGFLYSGGVYTIIDPPGSFGTYAMAINDPGQIVGYYADSSNHFHGFLDSGGTYTILDFPGAIDTYLDDINDSGQIVGRYQGDKTMANTASFIARAPSR